MTKTSYRVIPVNDHGSIIYYLQFEYIYSRRRFFGLFGKMVEKRRWCFVPKRGYPAVLGYWLHQHTAPTYTESRYEFIHGLSSDRDPISFAKQYPDIEVYFKWLREERRKHIEQEEAEHRNAKTTYL